MSQVDNMITIITPAYNAENTIQKLYKNLKPLINNDVKWIIVNDKSTDDTQGKINTIIKENKNVISYTLEKNEGPQFARYYGILKSETRFIFLLDADDYIYKNNFNEFIKFIKCNDQYDFYFSIIKSINHESHYSPNDIFIESKKVEIVRPSDFIFTSLPHPSSLVVNKEFYLSIYNDCQLSWGEDIYMYLLLSQYGKGTRWIKPVSCYVNNGQGRGSQVNIVSRYNLFIALFKQSLEAKRISSCCFSLYMTTRYLASYLYKKIRFN